MSRVNVEPRATERKEKNAEKKKEKEGKEVEKSVAGATHAWSTRPWNNTYRFEYREDRK